MLNKEQKLFLLRNLVEVKDEALGSRNSKAVKAAMAQHWRHLSDLLKANRKAESEGRKLYFENFTYLRDVAWPNLKRAARPTRLPRSRPGGHPHQGH